MHCCTRENPFSQFSRGVPSMLTGFGGGVFAACVCFTLCFTLYVNMDLSHERQKRLDGAAAACGERESCQMMRSLRGKKPLAKSEAIQILLWTPLRDYVGNWEEHFGPGWDHIKDCAKSDDGISPSITADRSKVDMAAVVVFNMNDLKLNEYVDYDKWVLDIMPPSRSHDQRWALFWREPPSKIKAKNDKLAWLDGLFNWTISYRRDSDIFYPFGQFQEIPHKKKLNVPWTAIKRRKGLAWHSNDCETASRREHLAMALDESVGENQTLVKHLYGKCLRKQPRPRRGKTVMDSLSQRARYYLALEDEICDDYVTEVYFQALNYSYVPVVFGGADLGYDEVGLAGTYIDALDYQTEDDLIEYLQELSDSKDEFYQYLAWQYDFKVLPATTWVCNLSEALSKASPPSVIEDFTAFWNSKKCYGSYLEAKFH